jgi:hypothetical protein
MSPIPFISTIFGLLQKLPDDYPHQILTASTEEEIRLIIQQGMMQLPKEQLEASCIRLLSTLSSETHAASASDRRQAHMATQYGQPLPITQLRTRDKRTWYNVTGIDPRSLRKPPGNLHPPECRPLKQMKLHHPTQQRMFEIREPYTSPYQAQSQTQDIALSTRSASSHAKLAQAVVSPSSSHQTSTPPLSPKEHREDDVSEAQGSPQRIQEAASADMTGRINAASTSGLLGTPVVGRDSEDTTTSQRASDCEDEASIEVAGVLQDLAQTSHQTREPFREALVSDSRVRAKMNAALIKDEVTPPTKHRPCVDEHYLEGAEPEGIDLVDLDATHALTDTRHSSLKSNNRNVLSPPPRSFSRLPRAPSKDEALADYSRNVSSDFEGSSSTDSEEDRPLSTRETSPQKPQENEVEDTDVSLEPEARNVLPGPSSPSQSSNPDAIEVVLAVPDITDSTGLSILLRSLLRLPTTTRVELESHLTYAYRTEDCEERCAEFVAARHRPLRVAEDICLHSMVCSFEMEYELSGGNKMHACDRCVRDGTICARIVWASAKFQLALFPLPERFRQGVGWYKTGFWLRK